MLDPVRQEMAQRYAREGRCLLFGELALGVAFLLFLLLSGLSPWLRDLLDFPRPMAVAIYLSIVMAAYQLLSLPLGYYGGFVLPHRYGLSREGLPGWLTDRGKETLLEWLVVVGGLVVVYSLMGMPAWWLWTAAFFCLLSAAASLLAPWLIIPLFFRQEPLPEGELKERLGRLAEAAGFRARGIFTVNWSQKGTGANAMLTGLGRRRRIILTDTLLQGYSPEEIETLLAHELGHARQGHIPLLLSAQAALGLLLLWLASRVMETWSQPLGFAGAADLAAFPLLALSLAAFGLMLAPLLLGLSRYLEGQADRYALRLTLNPQAFAWAMARLTDQNLIEAFPHHWVEVLLSDHPSYARRVSMAQEFAAGGQP